MNLKDKVVVITGGSRGIGKSIALECARLGANIAINYTSESSEIKALEVVEEVKKMGQEAICVKCDVSDMIQVEEFFKQIKSKFSNIDVLVNNAGITKDSLLIRMKEEDWDRVIDVNLKGVFNCSKIAAKEMMKLRKGKIINMTSVCGVAGNAGQANYSAAKAGVIGLTKSMARELASRNINVNAVAPGFIKTDMTQVLGDELKEAMLSNIPLKRLGEASDVANAVSFLASEISNYITGQVIHVDGGFII